MADGVKIEGMVFEAGSGFDGGSASAAPVGATDPSQRAVTPDLTEDDLALDRSLRPKRLGDYCGPYPILGTSGPGQDHSCHRGGQ